MGKPFKPKENEQVSEPWREVTIASLNESVTVRSNVASEDIFMLSSLALHLIESIRHGGDK